MNNLKLSSKVRQLKKHLEIPEVKTWRSIMIAFQSVFRELEKGLLAQGCSISRFQILLLLYFEGPTSAAEIARRMFVTRGNISMFLRRMELDCLIETIQINNGSKRVLHVLKKEGQMLFESLFPKHISRIRKLVPVLPKVQRLRLWKVLKQAGQESPRF